MELLKQQNSFTQLADTLIEVESYKIADYKTLKCPWRTLYS
jgi:hypothetical protein